MSDFVNYLQHRVEETKRKVQETTERLNQAIADREMLVADLAGYERALAAEMREQGVTVLSTERTAQDSLPLGDAVSVEVGVSKAEFARQFVKEHQATGVTPSDIFNGFLAAGIPIKKPYVYSLVQRLQGQEAIKARRGKYYPSEPEAPKEMVQ